MATTVVAAAEQAEGSASTYVFTTATTLGHTPATGNIVVVALLANSSVTPPAGWNTDDHLSDVWFFSRQITGTESASYTWTFTGTSRGACAWEAAPPSAGYVWASDTGHLFTSGSSGTSQSFGASATLHQADEFVASLLFTNSNSNGYSISGGGTWALVNEPTSKRIHYGSLITTATTALNPTGAWTSGSNTASEGGFRTYYAVPPPVTKTVTGVLNVNGTIAQTFTGKLNVNGTVTKTFTGLLNVKGPVPTGWTVRTEADWGGDPLTRPASMTSLETVTDGVTSMDIKRGTHILSAGVETGTSQGKFDNKDRKLDPSNAASPLYPNVKPRTRMRHIITVGGVDHVLHTGFAERFPIEWSQEVGYCTITTQDQLGLTATATLPRSTYEAKVRELGAAFYAPMTEDIGLGTASDIIGGRIGAYAGAVQAGSAKVMVADAQNVPSFQRPTNTATITENPRVEWAGFTVPHQFTFVLWFRWNPSNEFSTTSQPLPIALGASTNFGVPGGDANSPVQLYPYLGVVPALAGRHKPVMQIQDGSNHARLTANVGFTLFDGDYHMMIWEVDGINKVFKSTFDDNGLITLTDTGEAGTTPVASVNVNSVLDQMVSLMAGWNPGATPTATTPNGWSLGHLTFFDRMLSDIEREELWDAGVSAWDGDTTAERLTRVLDLVGIDTDDRNTFAGSQICGPTLLNGQNAQSYVKKILATELSELFIDADGKWTFPERADYGTPVCVFTDDPASDSGLFPGVDCVPYFSVNPDFSYDRIVNDLTIGRENGADQEVTDATSIQAYGQIAGTKYRTGQSGAVSGKLDTLHQTATAARDSAQWLIDHHKDPVTYIPSVTITSIDSGVTLDAMLREIGDTVVIRARPAGGGDPISLICFIEAVHYTFPSAKEWRVEYSVTDGTTYTP